MSLRALFQTVMDNYINARETQLNARVTSTPPRRENKMRDIFQEIRNEIEAFDFIGHDKYIVNRAPVTRTEIPWISITAITGKNIFYYERKTGIKIIYLFSSDMQRLYLTLLQSSDIIHDFSSALIFSKILILLLRKNGLNIDGWNTNIDEVKIGNESYEKGIIFYKKYEKNKLPDDGTLKNDLRDLINIYEHILSIDLINIYKSIVAALDINDVHLDLMNIYVQILYFLYVYRNKTSILSSDKSKENLSKNVGFNVKDEINNIRGYIEKQKFFYNGNLIENFYLSLKSKPFVILAGISGTGKSKFARLFAEAIGCDTENGRFMLVPVKPDWSDSTELLGYKDMYNEFQPGVLTDFIKRAINDINNPYFFVLDEMNLARVEHYFSDILSVMESRRRDGNKIITDPLLNKSMLNKDAFDKYGNLYIPENLYFIGTVNMDETTFPFSKKVLDRANVIEFSDVNFDYSVDSGEKIDEKASNNNLNNNFLKSEFLTLSDCNDHVEIINKVNEILKQINDVLRGSNLHFGYRIRDEISFYMIYNELNDLIDFDDAMDLEILQKILPSIHGSSINIKKILVELFKICVGNDKFEDEFKDIDKIDAEKMLEYKNKNNCVYPRSAEKIIYMVRRYQEDGFISYWL